MIKICLIDSLSKMFFVRVCGVFGIFLSKYSWISNKLDIIVNFYFSIANFHIRIHSLCEQNVDYNHNLISNLRIRIHDTKNNGQIRQLNHRNRENMSTLAMIETISDDESYGISIENITRENSEILELTILDKYSAMQLVQDNISFDN